MPRNYTIRIVVRGHEQLREDVEDIVREYLREGGIHKERILELLNVSLGPEEASLSNDLPILGTLDVRLTRLGP